MEEQNYINEFGKVFTQWRVDEYPNHDRSRTWYILSSIAGIALIIYAIVTANFLFAVIILLSAVITLLSVFRQPEKIDVAITSTGVVIGPAFYEFKDIKDFSIAYKPPEYKLIYFDFDKPWLPLVSIPLEDVDPNEVRECLLPFCLENLDRTNETLTDTVRRVYKL